MSGEFVAHTGELHPKVYERFGLPARTVISEIVLDHLIASTKGQILAAMPVSQQVLAKKDFAFVVSADLAADDLVRVMRNAGGDVVQDAH